MRRFNPLLCLGVAVLYSGLPAPPPVSAATAARPNIILIYVDDLGWQEVGYQGSMQFETPHIDRLTREGMIFTAGYSPAGNCAPSRACLLSGQYTPRHHVYAVGTTERGPKNLMRMVPVPNRRGLAPENVTVAGALKTAGYVTGIFGKWHLADGPGTSPGEQGFDVVHESYGGWSDPEPESDNPKGVYSLTRGLIEFIQQNRNRPFFAYLSHYAPHTRYQARPATRERFKAKLPIARHENPLYAACVYDMDDSVGLLLRELKQLGLEQNTLLVFTSDNGSNFSQEPLRGRKGSYYEAGIRVPFLVRWPGVVPAGTYSDVPVTQVDLYPTFLAAAGARLPEGKILDGENILPLMRGSGVLQREAIFWHFPGYLNEPVPRGRDPVFRTRPVSVINKGGWKLHLYHEEWLLDAGRARLAANKAVELYNLRSDIGEHRDLAASHPVKRDELLDDLLAWIEQSGARLPAELNPEYKPESAAPVTRAFRKGGVSTMRVAGR